SDALRDSRYSSTNERSFGSSASINSSNERIGDRVTALRYDSRFVRLHYFRLPFRKSHAPERFCGDDAPRGGQSQLLWATAKVFSLTCRPRRRDAETWELARSVARRRGNPSSSSMGWL